MPIVTLTNDFHHTSVRLRVPPWGRLSLGQVARARRELCGVADCTCGGTLGERGEQLVDIEDLSDGTARLRRLEVRP